jgi:hypothetical protein
MDATQLHHQPYASFGARKRACIRSSRSRSSAAPAGATKYRLFNAAAALLAFLMTLPLAINFTSGNEVRDMVVQGGWAYSQQVQGGKVQYIATTRAAEDDAWFLLACSAEERLAVSLIHTIRFPFPLNPSSLVNVRSNNLPSVSVEGKSVQDNLIFLDPKPMRHIMPLLLQEEQLVISVSERDGTEHDYTFYMQPNDLALKAIRSGCLDD